MPELRELWAKAPAALILDPDLSLAAIRIYLWLDLRAGKRGYWYGTQPEIASALSLTDRTVRRAIGSLEPRYVMTDREREKGMLRYAITARQTGHPRPLWSDSDRTPVSFRPDTHVRSGDAAPSLTTDPSIDPVKTRTRARSRNKGITPGTDWDAVMGKHQQKASGE